MLLFYDVIHRLRVYISIYNQVDYGCCFHRSYYSKKIMDEEFFTIYCIYKGSYSIIYINNYLYIFYMYRPLSNKRRDL